ncbi:MAG: type VI secretion system protein TssA [Gammaproteobacteria bacterium]
MSALAVETLLAEISPDAPCGADLAYEPEFTALEASAQGRPERVMGDEVVPGEEPDWSAVAQEAVVLLGRTKDVRLAVLLASARLNTDGLSGFADALELLHGLLERHWDFVHPQLERDHDDDATMRMNAIAPLGHGLTVVAELRTMVLASSRAFGPVSLRDAEIALGKLAVPSNGDGRVLAASDVQAIARECSPDELLANLDALARAKSETAAIVALIRDKVGELNSPNLSELLDYLSDAHDLVEGWARDRGLVAPAGAAGGEAGAGNGAEARAQAVGQVRNREDAVRALDSVSVYFKTHEPSSPVPLLVDRARRLVSQDFISIIKDLSPDAIAEIERLSGNSSGEE